MNIQMGYNLYATWHGYAIVKHDNHGVPVTWVAEFDYADKRTAIAVCRDLNRSVSRG